MEYMSMESASHTQARGYDSQQALSQVAEDQLLEREVVKPTRKIQAILKAGGIVTVNHARDFYEDINQLSRFLVARKITVHTYSYFSTPQSMNYNGQLTTSEERNNIRIKQLFARSEMKYLSDCIDNEVDTSIHERLSIIHTMVEKEYQELDLSSQATDENIKTFVCRHLSCSYIFDIIEVENIKIIQYFSTSGFDDASLNTMYDKLENKRTFISNAMYRMVQENFNKNITIGNLVDSKKNLNFMGMHGLDGAINQVLDYIIRKFIDYAKPQVLDCVTAQLRQQKAGVFALWVINENISAETNVEKKQQIKQAFYYLLCISRKLYPIVDNYFESMEDKFGFYYFCFSVAEFVKFLHECCRHMYYNKPINYEEKYLIISVIHDMGLKIKHEQDGIIIKFYDPNQGNEKIICITHGDYANEITISDFFTKKQLEQYGILLKDNYNLPTISCIRIYDLRSQ